MSTTDEFNDLYGLTYQFEPKELETHHEDSSGTSHDLNSHQLSDSIANAPDQTERNQITEQMSLWDQAYDELEGGLVKEYEQLLSAELSTEGCSSHL